MKRIFFSLMLLLSMGCAITQVELKARNDALEITKIGTYTVLDQAITYKNTFGGACVLVLTERNGSGKEPLRLFFYPDSGWNVCRTLSSQDRVKVNVKDEGELASGYHPNKEDWLTIERLSATPSNN